MTTNNKRILIITFKYYPLAAPRAFRWHTIASEWAKQGINVDVVCGAFSFLPRYEIVDGVQIYRLKQDIEIVSLTLKNHLKDLKKSLFNIQPSEVDKEQSLKRIKFISKQGKSSVGDQDPEKFKPNNDEDSRGKATIGISNREKSLVIPLDDQRLVPKETHKVCNDKPGDLKQAENEQTSSLIHKDESAFTTGSLKNDSVKVAKTARSRMDAAGGKKALSKHYKKLKSRFVKAVKTARRRTNAAIRNFFREYCWPDYYMYWIEPLYAFSRDLISTRDYDAVVAVSWPVSAHVVGLFLKQHLKSTKLIIDVGDPFSTNRHTPNNKAYIFQNLSTWFERKLLAAADYVTVTTEHTKDLYAGAFPKASSKIVVIPPVLASTSTGADSDKTSFFTKNPERLKLVFIGSLRAINRPPDTLLKLFKQFINESGQKVGLHLIGNNLQVKTIIDQYSEELPDNLYVYGELPREVAMKAQAEADVLINIGNKSDYQVPSKLVDYMASGKPIINLMHIPNDTSAEFMKDYPALCNLLIDTDEHFEQAYTEFKNFITHLPLGVSQAEIEKILYLYTPSVISKQYLDLVYGRQEEVLNTR